jgi:hypothetical protein
MTSLCSTQLKLLVSCINNNSSFVLDFVFILLIPKTLQPWQVYSQSVPLKATERILQSSFLYQFSKLKALLKYRQYSWNAGFSRLSSTLCLHLQVSNDYVLTADIFSNGSTAIVGLGLLYEFPRSNSGTLPLVGLLWKSDWPTAQTSTWQHTTPAMPRRDSKPKTLQASGRITTP